MSRPTDRNDLIIYLAEHGNTAKVEGIYKKSIILQSMLKKEKIFTEIKDGDFMNI
jgi:hypothetical protein